MSVGSSPRGRGTLRRQIEHPAARRFIPARAGNARRRARTPRPTPVHPRAGGERATVHVRRAILVGSSPRGRGTRDRARPSCYPRRFIPARAGNASDDAIGPCVTPVHPRAGGERPSSWSASRSPAGSSPRGRGTLRRTALRPGAIRFIPARAGNAPAAAAATATRSVHPRAGGERTPDRDRAYCTAGSSPRGRGTPVDDHGRTRHVRFIPARAGNASSSAITSGCIAVHPRAGGERPASSLLLCRNFGSSPRGRGTHLPEAKLDALGRFIPARAGNAATTPSRPAGRPVHPRAGGERARPRNMERRSVGSSPRGRGTRLFHRRRPRRRRFIPARAGNAALRRASARPASVHPRAGGERSPILLRAAGGFGSSPRGRGTPACLLDNPLCARFIPARAGNAAPRAGLPLVAPVHPRAGGERSSCNMLIQKIFFGSNNPTGISASEKRMAQVSRTAP